MAKSIYKYKTIIPSEETISLALNETEKLWNEIIQSCYEKIPNLTKEWKYYGNAWGWCLVLEYKKRKLIYLTPQEGYFYCSFIFNEQQRKLARESKFSYEVMKNIEDGRLNPAGHAFDIKVTDHSSVKLVNQLFDIKTNI